MPKAKSVRGQRTAHGFTKAVKSQGGHVSQGGRHAKLHHPGGGSVPVPRHRGDLARGTSFSITKMLLALGFTVFLCVLPTFLLLVPPELFGR